MKKAKEGKQTKIVGEILRVRPEKNKGITLIALVITIIIMLILVAVTVTYGIKSGLLGKAKESKEKYANSEEKETISLAANEWSIEKNVGTEKTFLSFMQEKLAEKAKIEAYKDEIIVEFNDTKNCYEVKQDGTIIPLGTKENAGYTIKVACMWGDIKTGEQIKDEYEEKSFFSDYSITLPEIEGYEKSTEIIEGSMPKDKKRKNINRNNDKSRIL